MAGPYTVTNDATGSITPFFAVTNPGDIGTPLRMVAKWTDAAPTAFKAVVGRRSNPGDGGAASKYVGGTLSSSWIGTDAVLPAPTPPTLGVGGAGNVNTGQHWYLAILVSPHGNIAAPTSAASVNPGVPSIINLTNIPVGPAGSGVTSRTIWRTKIGGTSTGPFFLVTTIADNTTTTYNDNTADAGLGAQWVNTDWAGGSQGIRPLALVVNFATTTTWARRFFNPSPNPVPQGTYRVFARFRKSVGTDDIRLRLQWGYGPASLTTASVKNDVQQFDGKDYNTTDIILADMGLVSVPSSGGGFYGEVWARQASGTGTIAFDANCSWILVPTDSYSVVSVQPNVIDEWNGDEANVTIGSPIIGNGVAQLIALNDEVRYYSGSASVAGGATLATGVHHLWIYDIEHSDDSMTSTLRVYDNTSAAVAASRTKTAAGREKLSLRMVAANGTDLYFAGVALTTAGTGIVTVNRVRHFVIYYLAQNEALMLDALARPRVAAQLDSSGSYVRAADHRGDWPYLGPGANDFIVLLVDSASDYPMGETHIITRAASLSLTGLPAYTS